MMSAKENFLIEQYLIAKKLPLDLLLEVKDHFSLQVVDEMKGNDISFSKAASRVANLWESDFEPTTYWFFFGHEKIPRIVKKILQQKYLVLFKKSLLWSLLGLLIIFCLTIFSENQQVFKISYFGFNMMVFLAPIFIYLKNYKIRDFFRKDYHYKGKISYTIYQHNVALLLIVLIGGGQMMIEGAENFYGWIMLSQKLEILSIGEFVIWRWFVYFFAVFSILNFNEHRKVLQKLKLIN